MEVLLLGLGTIGPPFVLCYMTGGDLHVLTVYVWILLRLFQAIDAHSGYHFPFSMANYFPVWAGALHHDSHHENFTGNYASSFTYLDHIFGTDSLWKKQQARKKDIRQLMADKGMTKADAKKQAIVLEKQREAAKAQ